jgi:hypothetical protein
MSEKEKKRFQEMADRDKNRYESEMQDYVPPMGEKGRGKKRAKDPNAPKRSLSAFFWFCNDERARIKGLNPEYRVGDVAKELGKLWGAIDPEVKRKYEAMAERDKARYERVRLISIFSLRPSSLLPYSSANKINSFHSPGNVRLQEQRKGPSPSTRGGGRRCRGR